MWPIASEPGTSRKSPSSRNKGFSQKSSFLHKNIFWHIWKLWLLLYYLPKFGVKISSLRTWKYCFKSPLPIRIVGSFICEKLRYANSWLFAHFSFVDEPWREMTYASLPTPCPVIGQRCNCLIHIHVFCRCRCPIMNSRLAVSERCDWLLVIHSCICIYRPAPPVWKQTRMMIRAP